VAFTLDLLGRVFAQQSPDTGRTVFLLDASAARRGTIARMLEPPNTARPMLRRAAGMRLLRRPRLRRPPCGPKY
ncbi:hypothetical protein ACX84U_35020, partial [Burkholderia pseudomallei]